MQQQGEVHVHVQCSCIGRTPPDLSGESLLIPHLRYITHVPLQRAMADPASGHKFTSPDPLGGKRERHRKRERKGGTRLLHALLEREMNHG